MNKHRLRDYRRDPWWLREYGGMPGWAIVAICVLILGVLAVALVMQATA
ncbi:hypothetical protein [Microbacterium sp. No. 7]|nr:hypothetical protein [Microbacterium sp. No. 7]